MRYNLTPNDSINEALKKCKINDEIYLSNGIYNEKVIISIDGIALIGESKENVIIQNKDFFYKIMADFNECNTFRTFTIAPYLGFNYPKFRMKTIFLTN